MENNNHIEKNNNICKKCNTPNENNFQFCEKCGAKLSNKKPIIIGTIAIVLYLIGFITTILINIGVMSIIIISITIGFDISFLPSFFMISGIVMAIYGAIKYSKNYFLRTILILIVVSLTSYFIISFILICISEFPKIIADIITCGTWRSLG